jgi:phosphomannomutase
MGRDAIVIVDGGRRLPRADLLVANKEPGLFSRFSATQLGGMAIKATVAAAEADLGADGRVVVRPSGTEQLVRVMVEAKRSEADLMALVERIGAVISRELA